MKALFSSYGECVSDLNNEDVYKLFYSLRLKSFKRHHFISIYDQIFKNWVKDNPNSIPTIVEVGSAHGGFLEFLDRYFGGKCKVIGIDIEIDHLKNTFKLSESQKFNNLTLIKGNSSDLRFWQNFWDANESLVDIFIEDSGHTNKQQITSVKMALERIKPGGIIVCEDIETSFMSEFGNPHPFSFMNWLYRLISFQNLALVNGKDSALTHFEISLSPSIVILKKSNLSLYDYRIIESGGQETKNFGSIFPSIQLPFLNSSQISGLILKLNKSLIGYYSIKSTFMLLKFWRFNLNFLLIHFFKKKRFFK
jgi:SAM-dependent methyltransferase